MDLNEFSIFISLLKRATFQPSEDIFLNILRITLKGRLRMSNKKITGDPICCCCCCKFLKLLMVSDKQFTKLLQLIKFYKYAPLEFFLLHFLPKLYFGHISRLCTAITPFQFSIHDMCILYLILVMMMVMMMMMIVMIMMIMIIII